MERSFLNIVTVDGKLFRIAELGFHADQPSFGGDCVIFSAGGKFKKIYLATGMMTSAEPVTADAVRTSPNGRFAIRTETELPDEKGFGYVHLILEDKEKSTETVLTRFMGDENSIGPLPFSADSASIVFFGYPERELG